MKILWWKLSNREKARRSFILAPLGFLFALLPSDAMIFVLNKWEFVAVSILLMVVQGLYYKRKAEKEDQSNNAE
ncbi:hypothetical protein [Vibrio sp. 10N.247.311.51]|uniref:hypothetical protein n=1 Tax=Vibrio sp. 10N.247.311.51 TaxID=3229996 RepID=UPI00354EF48E